MAEPDDIAADMILRAILAELTTIRELLEQQGICPHGNSGVCMYCIRPFLDAIEMNSRPRRNQ